MAIYQGVLTYISGGSSVGGTVRNYDGYGRPINDAVQQIATHGANVTTRQFIEIGGQRLKKVQLTNLHDELLQRSLGSNVAISVTKAGGGYIVKAIKLADGTVDKLGAGTTWGSFIIISLSAAVPIIFLAVLVLIGIAFKITLLAVIAAIPLLLLVWFLWKAGQATVGGGDDLTNVVLTGGGQPVAQQYQAPPPPPVAQPASPDWQITHFVPGFGMRAWEKPDPAAPPVTTLQGGVELCLRQSWGSWARVEGRNGWIGWVEGNLLQPRSAS